MLVGEAGRKQEWWGEPRLLFDITTIILLSGSDLVSPWLVSIQWPVITVPQEFPLYVPLSSALQPTTAGNLVKKPLRSTGWSGSVGEKTHDENIWWWRRSWADIFLLMYISWGFWRFDIIVVTFFLRNLRCGYVFSYRMQHLKGQ